LELQTDNRSVHMYIYSEREVCIHTFLAQARLGDILLSFLSVFIVPTQ
jgi:hypothetical protein